MEKILTIIAAVVVFIVWATIRSRRIQKDRLKNLKILLGSLNQLLVSDVSEVYLYNITYSNARDAMEWFFQIQNNEIYKTPDENSEIGILIENFKAKINPYRPIKNSESFLLQIANADYLIILSENRESSSHTSVFLEMEKVTSETLLRDSHPVNDYTPDWSVVSANYRKEQNYICENCGVDLSSERRLLHVHHKNRDKGDNRKKNLVALCAICHKTQPYHEKRLDVPINDFKKISLLKTQQGLQK